jgi:hypothetical protein
MRPTGLCALAATFSVLLTVGCSSTHQVVRPSSLDSFAEVTDTGEGPIDVIVTPPASEDPHSVEAVRSRSARLLDVGDDGISVRRRGEQQTLSLRDIRGYDVTRRGQGALEGLGIGLLAGVTFGVVAGLAAGDDPPCAPENFCIFRLSAGDKAAISGVVAGLTGALSGALIGALVGHTDHYVF